MWLYNKHPFQQLISEYQAPVKTAIMKIPGKKNKHKKNKIERTYMSSQIKKGRKENHTHTSSLLTKERENH